MFRNYRNFIAYWLICQVLYAAVGIPLHTRTCAMPNMADEISAYIFPESCCAHAADTHCTQEASLPLNPCCEFSSDYWKGDFQQFTYQIPDFSKTIFVLFEIEFGDDVDLYATKFIKLQFTDSSPPSTGRNILLRKHSLLI